MNLTFDVMVIEIVSLFDIPSNTDVIENTVMLNQPFNVNIVSLNDDLNKCIQHSEYTASTDGSKIEGKAGSGLVISKHHEIIYKQSYNLPDNASVFPAELEAIRQSALFFKKKQKKVSG